jgi:hypothetical protein
MRQHLRPGTRAHRACMGNAGDRDGYQFTHICRIPNIAAAENFDFLSKTLADFSEPRGALRALYRLRAGRWPLAAACCLTGTCSTISTLNPSSAGTFVGVLLISRMR